MEEKLLKLLYDEHILNDEQYETLQQEQEASGESCEQLLERLNILSEAELLAFLGKRFHLPVLDWDAFNPDEDLLRLVPLEIAQKYMVFPYLKEQGKRQTKLTLAVADPSDIRATDDVTFMTGCTIKTALASKRAIREAIQRYYDQAVTQTDQAEEQMQPEGQTGEEMLASTGISAVDSLLSNIFQQLKSEEEDQADPLAALDREHPSTRILFDLLELCVAQRFSEIHIEPRDGQYTIRLSQKGDLREHTTISTPIGQGIATSLRRVLQLPQKGSIPQSGSFSTTLVGDRAVQLQLHFYPGIFGEKIQITLKNISELDTLEQLGLDDATLKTLGRLIARPQGLLLLVSPLKHGKTTTLYALLHKLRQSGGQILSLESSVERFLPQVTQVPFSSKNAYQEWCSFIAYQAPQVLAIDHPAEIDLKGRLALEFAPASLVLMTMTAPDMASGICQLIASQRLQHFSQDSDAGLSLLPDTINGVFSQRLVKTLCPHCKQETSLSQEDLTLIQRLSPSQSSLEHFSNYTAKGCAECRETGYAGQAGIFEVIKFDRGLKQSLLQHQTDCAYHIRQYCAEASLGSMTEQAFRLLREGRSSLSEIRRALQR